jgi:hypothetical protein
LRPQGSPHEASRGRTSTILSKETEESIVVWVNELRDEGVPVSIQKLTIKPRELANAGNIKDFEASDKWVGGFKKTLPLQLTGSNSPWPRLST